MKLDTTEPAHAQGRSAGLATYLSLARMDHSTKHIFVAPGFALAYILRGPQTDLLALHVFLGLVTVVAIASANYVINEYQDRDYDRHHPTKSQRTAVQYNLCRPLIVLEWLAFLILGLTCAWFSSLTMFFIAGVFALQGVCYNTPPLRTKDKPYLDVVSESINNPLRLLIGWTMVDPTTLPPSSILFSYWFGGAFLMAAKRYSEYREIVTTHGRDLLVRYRASFAGYSEISLDISCFVYAMLSTFFLAIFLVKYRVEYLLLMPAVITLFAYYLILSTRKNSLAQNPQKLFRDLNLMLLVVLLGAVFILSTLLDIPVLAAFASQRYITLQ